jgi:hypothetical protein
MIDTLKIDWNLFAVVASSCFYGIAGGLLVSRKIAYRYTGLTLIGVSILAGFISIWVAIGTGCGA